MPPLNCCRFIQHQLQLNCHKNLPLIDNNWIKQIQRWCWRCCFVSFLTLSRQHRVWWLQLYPHAMIRSTDHMLRLHYSTDEDSRAPLFFNRGALPAGWLLTPRLDTLLKWLSMWILLLLKVSILKLKWLLVLRSRKKVLLSHRARLVNAIGTVFCCCWIFCDFNDFDFNFPCFV